MQTDTSHNPAALLETWVGDAVEELDKLFAIEYLDNLDVAGQYVYSFGFHLTIGADLDVEHVSTCTASSPAFDDGFSVYNVTFPAVVGR